MQLLMKIKPWLRWLFMPLMLVLAGLFIFSDFRHGLTSQEFEDAKRNQFYVFTYDIPKDLTFAGEKVPVDTFWVREALDRELLSNVYFHSSTFLMIKRAHRYFTIIEPILKKNGVPDDFKYLALCESGLTNVVSPAGAAGYWQFLKETGLQYNLEITDEVDERYHLEKATAAACAYLKNAFARFGNWTLAAAAYNAGSDNISKPMSQQQASSYYDLLLNQETSRYIFRILALKEIFRDPAKYGFFYRNTDLYPVIPCRQVTIDSTVNDLASFAISQKINYKILKELNPWLRKNTLNNKLQKKYVLQIPEPKDLLYSRLFENSLPQH